MTTMILGEDKEEAAMVERIFNEIRETLDEGKGYRDARRFDEAAFVDGRGESFSDYPNENCPSASSVAGVAGAFPYGELVRIPYGALVYVYRDLGNGYAVYDVYSFGYGGRFAVMKDVEGDLAGLVNLGGKFFPL